MGWPARVYGHTTPLELQRRNMDGFYRYPVEWGLDWRGQDDARKTGMRKVCMLDNNARLDYSSGKMLGPWFCPNGPYKQTISEYTFFFNA